MKHLCAVVTEIDERGFILAVNFDSIKPDQFCDESCLVEKGAHKFITLRSFIYYRRIAQLSAKAVSANIKSGYYPSQPAIADDLFKRICNGILDSDHTPRWAREFYRRVEGLDKKK